MELDYERIKRVILVITEVLALAMLLFLVAHYGFGTLFGTGVARLINKIVEFGVLVITGSGMAVSLLTPTRRQQMLRDTEGDLGKYLLWLLGLQIIAILVGREIPMIPSQFQQLPNIMIQILITVFSFKAMITPISYMAKMVNLLKAVEFRNPNKAIERYYR